MPPPGRFLTCPHCPVRVPARVPLSNPGAHARPCQMSVLNVVSPLKLRVEPIMPGSGKRPPAGPAPGGNAVIKEARAGMTLDSADAAELAEMLSFIVTGSPAPPAASAHH